MGLKCLANASGTLVWRQRVPRAPSEAIFGTAASTDPLFEIYPGRPVGQRAGGLLQT